MISGRRRRVLRVGGAVATAALLAGCSRLEAPWHLLGLVALVPWLLSLDSNITWREAAESGAAAAVAYTALVLGWFPPAIAAFSGLPAGAVWPVFLLLAPLQQPQFLVAAMTRFWARRGRSRPGAAACAAGALAWVGTEWILPKMLGDTLGLGLLPGAWLRQAADLCGVAGVTLLLLIANELARALVAAAWRRERALAPALGLAALLAAWAGYGALRLGQIDRAERRSPLVVGIVQGAIGSYERLAAERGTYAVVREVLDVHEAISESLVRQGAQLVLWPETVYPTTFGAPRSEVGAELDREIETFAASLGATLVFGAYEAVVDQEFNAAFLLSPGGARQSYRKSVLFPLTEYVPWPFDRPSVRRLFPWLGAWAPGPGPRALPVRGGDRTLRVGPLLCYEAVEAEHAAAEARQGAELLVALSNDSWFSGGPGPRLHLAVAAFRSIETRLPMVRAANTGISAVVDATGEIVASVGVDQRSGLLSRVSAGPALKSPFLWTVRVFGPASLLAALLMLAWSRRPSRTAA